MQLILHHDYERSSSSRGLTSVAAAAEAECQLVSSCAMKCRSRSRYWLYSSTSLCPAPCNQVAYRASILRISQPTPGTESKVTIIVSNFSLGVAKSQSLSPHLDPEGFDGPGALLVDGEAVREVDHVVLRAVDHQHGRGYLDQRGLPDCQFEMAQQGVSSSGLSSLTGRPIQTEKTSC